MDSDRIYRQLEYAYTNSGKDKIIADHIAELYKQLEQLNDQDTMEPKQKIESIDLGFTVEYFKCDPEGWILKRESKEKSYRWYVYRDELLGECCPNWWWTEIIDYNKLKQYEELYQQAR